MVNHPNKWLRNVFRHYIQYLYYRRRIVPETFGWIMEVVPSRSYKLDVRPYQISLEDVKMTLAYLREHHMAYYTVYRVMLEPGARFEHILRMTELWNQYLVSVPRCDYVDCVAARQIVVNETVVSSSKLKAV